VSVPRWVCPSCRSNNMPQSPDCYRCGAAKPPPAPPSYVPPQPAPAPPPPAAAPIYYAVNASAGPLDDTERNVSMVWTAIGLVFAGLLCAAAVDMFTRYCLLPERGWWPGPYSIFAAGLFAWLFSFLLMRFRRLYLAAPSGTHPPEEILNRRARFSVIASFAILGVIVLGISSACYEVYTAYVRTQEAAAVAAREREQAAAERAAEQRAEQATAERAAEQRAEQATAERVARQQAAERPQPLTNPDGSGAAAGGFGIAAGGNASQLPGGSSSSRSAEGISAQQAARAAAVQRSIEAALGRARQQAPDAASQRAAQERAATESSPMVNTGIGFAPRIMPCGHPYAKQLGLEGGGPGGFEIHVFVCTRGDRFILGNGAWAPAPPPERTSTGSPQ